MTSTERADRIAKILRRESITEGIEEALADLIADAMHYALREGVDFHEINLRASNYVEWELHAEANPDTVTP